MLWRERARERSTYTHFSVAGRRRNASRMRDVFPYRRGE